MSEHHADGPVGLLARPTGRGAKSERAGRGRKRSGRASGRRPQARVEPRRVEALEARRRGRSARVLIPLFLASGATSLIYETVWARQLHLVFGTSQLAVCTLLAAFMGGLALGAFAAARWGSRLARPLLAYAVIEAFIGVYALAFPYILELTAPVYLGLWRGLEPGPMLAGVLQFLLLGAVLLPPTVCMGATLPLLARFVSDPSAAPIGKRRGSAGNAGFQVGRLYGANTLGAVLGTGLAGFVLLPQLGLAVTTWWTAGANGLLALAALGLARVSGTIEPTRKASTGFTEPGSVSVANTESSFASHWPLMMVAGLAGLSSLLYEVAWFRLMTLILGGSAYAFSIMLLAFLLGIGIGGWLGGGAADRSFSRGGRARVLRQLAWLQIGVAALAWAAMHFYGQIPFVFVWLYGVVGNTSGWLWPSKLLLALGVMMPPALLMGATFPALVRAAVSGTTGLSRPVGRLYGMNTLGAIVGAAGGGLFLLPALHMQGTVLAAASFNVVAALIAGGAAMAAVHGLRRMRLALWALAASCAIAVGHWQAPAWNPILMTSGIYKYVARMPDRSRAGVIAGLVRPFDLLFYDEGLSSVVTVARDRRNGNIWLSNNGKVDASSQKDLRTQVLLAHLPFAFRPAADRVLVIGLASGISAGSVTLHRPPTHIDVVEIEPAVVAASHQFDEVNHRPLADPRVHLHINDARNHLLLTADGTYDLVTSEPSNPWLSGASNLFTREFFALGKRKMRPAGVWAQWVQLYGMNRDDLRSLLATFADVYGHVRLFRVDESDLVLVGSDEPLPLRASDISEMFRGNLAVAEDLGAIGCRKPGQILGLYQFSRETMIELAGSIELNTDDNMRIEYSAPLHLHADTRKSNCEMLQRVAEVPVEAVEGAGGFVTLAKTYVTRDYSWRRVFSALACAAALSPDDPEVQALTQAFRELEASQAKPVR